MKKIKLGTTLTVIFLIAVFVFIKDYRTFVVMSGSMEDTIHVGSVVVVKPQDDYFVNDIVTFTKGNQVVTHRLIAFDEQGSCITKGDANQSEDPSTTSKNQIIGKVVLTLPNIGYCLMFMRNNPLHILSMMVILVSVYVGFSFFKKKNRSVI